MSDYDQFAENPAEGIMGKANGHHSRLPLWTEQFLADPTDDYLVARQLFATQMFLSGSFRIHSMLNATSQEEYDRLREHGHKMPITVIEALGTPEVLSAPLSVEELVAKTLETVDFSYTEHTKLAKSLPHTTSHEQGKGNQQLSALYGAWLGLAIDYINFAPRHRNWARNRAISPTKKH